MERLTGASFLDSLPREAAATLEELLVLKTYPAGMCIIQDGEENAPVFFVHQGIARVFKSTPEGREQILTYLKPGDGFNIPAAFAATHRAPANVFAVSRVQLLVITPENLHEAIRRSPGVAFFLLQDMSEKLLRLSNLVHDLSLLPVRSRLARFLWLQSMNETHELKNWTREEMAARIGTTREVVSRALRSLIDNGLLKTDRHRIIITNLKELKKEAGQLE